MKNQITETFFTCLLKIFLCQSTEELYLKTAHPNHGEGKEKKIKNKKESLKHLIAMGVQPPVFKNKQR